MRRIFVLSTLLLVVTAQLAEAGRKDDFDFAQGLVDRKYYDLAKKEFEKIIADGDRPAEQRADGELGLALLLKAQARDASQDRKMTTDEILAVFGDAESRFDKFLESYPNHPKLTDARFEVAGLLQDKGIFLTTRMAKPEEADNVDALRRAAEEAFDLAIDIFGEVAEKYEAIVERDGPEAQKYDWLARRVRFFHGVCYYYKGRLFDAGSSERNQILERAAEILTDFVWENEDNILGGYAYFYLGLCKRALDEPAEAMEFFTVASSNYPIPEDPRDRRIWGELFFQSYYKLGEYCNELKQRDDIDYSAEAVKRLKEMRERLPECETSNFGLRALLELARAHMNLGETAEAMDLCSLVSQRGEEFKATTTWGEGIEFLANRLLNEVIAEAIARGEKVTMDPAKLLKAALGKKASREWDDAVRSFQQVVTASEGSDENEKEFGIPAWLEIGQCYYRAGKFLEAYFTYDHIVSLFRGKDRQVAGDAAYFRYRSANAQHSDTKAPRDEALRKKARSAFATEFKDHPRSIDLQYYEGADLIDDARARSKTNELEAERLYNQAIGLLQGVKRSSILFAKAKARVGEIQFRMKKYDDALDQFNWVARFVNNSRNVTTDREQKLNRLQALAIGTYYGALCLSRKEQWKDSFARLEEYETKFADDNVKDFHAPVKFERILVLLKLGRLDDAEARGLELREMYESDARTPLAFYRLGMSFSKRAEEFQKKDEARWRENLAKAAEYLSYYISRKAKPTARDWRTIGAWYYKLEDWGKAEENIEKALALYNAQLDLMKGKSPEKTEILAKVGHLSVMLSDLLLKQGKFADAKNVFEELLIPESGARARVLALLKQQVHTRTSIKELMSKIRAVPSFMVGLAEVYINLGGQGDLLRAITLLNILSKADPKLQYSEDWWNWQLMQSRAYLDYGISLGDQQAFENIIAKYRQWQTLGVLKNSGLDKDFTRIYQQAVAGLRKMGIKPK